MISKTRWFNRFCPVLAMLFTCTTLLQLSGVAQQKKPLTRRQSFFGIHFDFHAGREDLNVGATLTEAMVDSLLTIVKPDFIQVDCKGHPGITSFPTTVGTPATSFAKDPLRIFRDVTSRHGVALYVHYSGVKDIEAIRKHPEWARINQDGSPDPENTSVHSAYNDQLLIPQLKEAIEKYHINGAWVDGDCWATAPDYSEASLSEYFKQTGKKPLPAGDIIDTGFMQFSRRSFLDYVQHYATSLHKADPSFQVASNWAFTSFMPQPVNVDVDFISGDLTPNNSVVNAGFEARCIASQALKYNIPWDIMSWGFSMSWDRNSLQSQKSVTQLTQEAAEIIAVGGGFQCYFTQNRDASIRPWQIPVMKGLADFMRARQPYCRNAKPVPQVAVLYSSFDKNMRSGSLFTNGGLDAIRGITNVLLDAQQSVQVLSEHQLSGNMQEFPVIVLPDTKYLESSFRAELLEYAKNGGHLLLIGEHAVNLFAKESNIQVKADTVKSTRWLGFNGSMTALEGYFPTVTNTGGVAIGSLFQVQDLRYPSVPASTRNSYGKGTITSVFANLGVNYLSNQSYLQRDFIEALVHDSYKQPLLEVKGSHLVHVVLNKVNDSTVLHLINVGGQHANASNYSYDELPPIGPVKVALRQPKPHTVTLEPAHRKLPFEYKNGQLLITVPSVAIHNILIIK